MEVMRPQLMWIGNRCYRKNPLRDSNPEDGELALDAREASSSQLYCDEVCDEEDVDIKETSQGLVLKLELPAVYYKFIIGKKGETRARIQAETNTKIMVPKPGDKQEIVSILGHDKRSIMSAKTRIDVLLESARHKQQFTHFLSVPVNSDQILMGFEDFMEKVLDNCAGDRGLNASLFQNPNKLHLTLGTMILLNDTEIQKAVNLLHACQTQLIEPILRGERLQVHMKGLKYMNDDPSSVDVLYAQIEPGADRDRLQTLADKLVDRFTAADLMQREHDHVKLHMTVMNTLMRKDPSGTSLPKIDANSSRRNKLRESFDAVNVLKRFGEFNFGSQHVSSIHLSQRYSTGQDEYYHCVSSLTLPG